MRWDIRNNESEGNTRLIVCNRSKGSEVNTRLEVGVRNTLGLM